MLESIRNAIERAIPTYAECGGFIYLGTAIEDRRMVNVINTKTILTNRLQNFGYIKLIAEEDNLFCKRENQSMLMNFIMQRAKMMEMLLLLSRIQVGD